MLRPSLSPLLLLPLLAPSAAAGEMEELVELVSGLEDPGRRADALEELAELGREDVDVLISLVINGAPGLSASTLEEGLRMAPRPEVVGGAQSLLEREAAPPERAAGLRVLGWVGGPREVGAFLLGARWAAEDVEFEAFEEALAAMLTRDLAGFSEVERGWRQLPVELRPGLVRAAAGTRDPRALATLGAVLDLGGESTRLVLERLPMVLPSNWPPPPEVDPARVRRFLDPARDECRSAAIAVGRLGDSAAVPLLIDLLDSESSGVRANAHWALEQITGLRLAPSAAVWTRWYDDDRAWYRREANGAFLRLDSADTAEVLSAIREISGRRLHRHDLAQEVEVALQNDEATVRAAACGSLGSLASLASVPALVVALDDDSDPVRAAALAALRKITGRDGSADPAEWAELAASVSGDGH